MSIKHALLALLYRQPMHGYELSKNLAITLKSDWDVKPGHIASTLSRLEQANLIAYQMEEADAAPDRKVFRLTESGMRELTDWYLTPEIREYRMGDTFYIKLVFSLISGPVPPEQVLIAQKRELFQELHKVMRLREQIDAETDLPLLLLLETAVLHLEADVRWIEMCEARLEELKRYRPPAPQPLPRGRPRNSLSQEE
jgi:DNA-binding PadR family transcriptional regulator